MDTATSRQYINFSTRDFSACISIDHVTKVIALPMLSYSPGSPDYVIGLLNVTGNIIPVIDLSMRLNVSHPDKYTINTPILICKNSKHQTLGLIVDKVEEVIEIDKSMIQSSVEKMDKKFIDGVVKRNNILSLLINVENILE